MTRTIVAAQNPILQADLADYAIPGDLSFRVEPLVTPEQTAAATRDADAVMVAQNPLTAAHIEAFGPNVRLIARTGSGLDAIDLEAAERRGLTVYHVPDYCTAEVATQALALILAVQRRVMEGDRIVRAVEDWRAIGRVAPLDEQTAGVIGAGRIGRAAIARLRPFVRAVLAYDPYLDAAPDGVELVPDLDAMLRRTDVLTLHLPLTDESRGMIGARELALLRPGAIVVNVSRGGIIDQAALVDALRSGHLAGAGLDVTDPEPPAADDPLMDAPNLVLSPHVGWYSTAAQARARTQSIAGIVALLDGHEPTTGRIAVDGRRPG
jgi:D-3-phosphoglycerate dehydrogenase